MVTAGRSGDVAAMSIASTLKHARQFLAGLVALGLAAGFAARLAGLGAWSPAIWAAVTVPVLLALLAEIVTSLRRGDRFPAGPPAPRRSVSRRSNLPRWPYLHQAKRALACGGKFAWKIRLPWKIGATGRYQSFHGTQFFHDNRRTHRP